MYTNWFLSEPFQTRNLLLCCIQHCLIFSQADFLIRYNGCIHGHMVSWNLYTNHVSHRRNHDNAVTFLNNRQATTLPGLLILQFQVQLIAVFNFILYTLSLDFCYISESFLECIVQEISLYIIYDLDGLILNCMLVQLVSENRLVSGLKMIKVQIVMTLKHTFSMPKTLRRTSTSWHTTYVEIPLS